MLTPPSTDTVFLRGHELSEDEFMLCESFPPNKHLQGQVRMVWPVRGNILRVLIQLIPFKDTVKYFEVLFHNWPGEYELKQKDTVLLLLKGATKTLMLRQDSSNGTYKEGYSFRVSYGHGAILCVQRKNEEFFIDYFKEQAIVHRETVEKPNESTENFADLHNLRRQPSVDSGSSETRLISRPSSALRKKSRRHKKKHKNKKVTESVRNQESVSAPVEVKNFADQPLASDTSSPNCTLSVQYPSSDLLAGLPDSYTALGKVAYKNMYSVIGIVTDAGIIKTTRTGDVMKSFILVDPSSVEQGLTVNVFTEPENQRLLPSTYCGQILLLRNVYIQKFNDRPQGACHKDKLQWCGYDPSSGKHFYSVAEITTSNSVFFAIRSEELRYFITLATWWDTLHNTTTKDNINVMFQQSLTDRRSKLKLISGLEAHVFSDCLVELLKVQPIDEKRADIFVTDYSENPELQCFNTSDFPLGKRVLKITLWEEARSLASSLVPGKIYLFKNIKFKSYGFLEGNVGGYGFRGIQEISSASPQPNLPELLARKKAYEDNPSSIWLRPKSPTSDVPAPLHQSHGEDTTRPLTLYHETDSKPALVADALPDNFPKKFRLRCRIMDYYPRDVKDFIYITCAMCGKKLATTSKLCLECGDRNGSSAFFAYRFVLRVIDQNGHGLNVRVSGKEADTLLENLSVKEAAENDRLLFQRLQFLLGHLYKFHDTFVEEDRSDRGPWFDLELLGCAIDGVHDVYKLTSCNVVDQR